MRGAGEGKKGGGGNAQCLVFDFVDYFLLICESTLDVRVPSSTCVDLAG